MKVLAIRRIYAMSDSNEVASSTTNATASNGEFSKGDMLLRLPSVIKKIPISRAKIYRDMAAGTFPQSISLSPGVVVWRESDLDSWVRARIVSSAEVR